MQISGAILARSRTFWITLALFLALNLATVARYLLEADASGQERTIGFPFPFLIGSGLPGEMDVYALGAALDVAIALTVALIATWIALALSTRESQG